MKLTKKELDKKYESLKKLTGEITIMRDKIKSGSDKTVMFEFFHSELKKIYG